MVSKTLSGAWALFALSLLAAAGITITFCILWGLPNMIVHFVVDSSFLTAGLGLGISYAITFVIAVIAIVQPNHITMGLAALNWILLLEALFTTVLGTIIWFFTLRERTMYETKWLSATPEVRIAIQDKFQCCGYFASNETNLATGGFCVDSTFATNLNTPCVGPLVNYADYTLNNIFTSIYGYMAIVIGLFLATVCVINKRIEAERFRKIDAKRGGKGFV
ncbi:hypothetical protein BKA62DRAFT_667752 [Auriculariales sp. MPI-PUGE-AT-0066]|nr:hypothetical protein BKA62DRAFT_667752 [Auriculariales sp. MPI-PUGE-AT-0066]